MQDFISPNWHVVFIHFPLAFLSIGVLIELLSHLRVVRPLRDAGRWMILLGAFFSIPAAFSGIYAFRDVAAAGPIHVHRHWHEVVDASEWSAAHWEFIERHVWLNASATLIALVAVVTWIAMSTHWRGKLYWPLLLLLLAAVGLQAVGGWFGGEMVYRGGIGVDPQEELAVFEEETVFLRPLQAHVVLGGFVLLFAAAGLALTLRFGRRGVSHLDEPGRSAGRGFWTAATAVGVVAAAFGVWSVTGTLTTDSLRLNLQMLAEPDHRRLLWHVIFGVVVILLPLVPALFARSIGRRTYLVGGSMGLFLVALAVQIWLGIALLYDSHHGPLTRFAAAEPAVVEPEEEPDLEDVEPAASVAMTDDLAFEPRTVSIAVGEVVEWTSPGTMIHTVTADPDKAVDADHVELPEGAEPFDSGNIEAGETYRRKFTVPGRYRYFCVPHEAAGMIGEIEVTEAPPGEPEPEPEPEAEVAAKVEMTDGMDFEPRKVTIAAGETVEWTNPSRVFHTVTADAEKANDPNHVELPEGAEAFDSGEIQPGETYRRTFTVPGRYRYFCIPHQAADMVGEIEVTEGNPSD